MENIDIIKAIDYLPGSQFNLLPLILDMQFCHMWRPYLQRMLSHFFDLCLNSNFFRWNYILCFNLFILNYENILKDSFPFKFVCFIYKYKAAFNHLHSLPAEWARIMEHRVWFCTKNILHNSATSWGVITHIFCHFQ